MFLVFVTEHLSHSNSECYENKKEVQRLFLVRFELSLNMV
jgi:hypothetical protein